ncbi:MAG: serine acetyltransferase [Ruminococcaceae bacterium]|nr:serine acetyltransferase [Oscillospiraceae bacterium]
MASMEKVQSIIGAILADYESDRDIDRVESFHRPDKDVVIDIIEKLQRIVFPGYFRDKNYRMYSAKNNLSVLIEDTMINLTKQLTRVYQSTGEDAKTAQEKAEEVCMAFFAQIPQVRELVQTDLQAAYDGDPAATGMAEIIFAYPGLFAITVYRLAHILYTLKVPMLPRIMTEHAHSITGIDIHPGATIGKFFFIDHGTGIVIGETSVIGNNVKIYQGVTLGGLSTRGGQSLRGKRRHPTIEDNVTIYANAAILGGDTVIGADSVIGASAFITASIPPSTTVSLKNQELQMKSHN